MATTSTALGPSSADRSRHEAADDNPGSARRRIRDEAGELFVRRGYEATSMRDIATAVGIKAGSLYHHFPSKDDLLLDILHTGIDVVDAAFGAAAAASAQLPPPQRLEHQVRAHLSALFEYGPYTATHVTTFRTAPPAVREVIVRRRDAYEQRWNAFLAELRDTGAIRADADLGVLRLSLLGAMNTTIDWLDPADGGLDRFATVLAHQFWAGVAA